MQSDFGTINPNTESGTQLATDLNNYRNARDTKNSGTSRPSYAVAGMEWMNTSGATYLVYLFDGTNDVLLGTLNPTTHTFVQNLATLADGGSMTSGANTLLANLGIGAAAPSWQSGWKVGCFGGNSFYGVSGGRGGFANNLYFDGTNWRYVANGYAQQLEASSSGGFTLGSSASSGAAGAVASVPTLVAIDANGNLGLDVAANTGGSRLAVAANTNTEGTNLALFYNLSATNTSVAFVLALGNGANSAYSAVYLNKNSSTNRSLNAAGTVNATGADYAEYESLESGVTAQPGQIIGRDAAGKLTNLFANAVTFAVVSTDPSYVGGDTYFTAQRPTEPVAPIAPTAPVAPSGPVAPSAPVAPTVPADGASDPSYLAALVAYGAAEGAYQTALAAYNMAEASYPSALAAYNAAEATYQTNLAAYNTAEAAYQAALAAYPGQLAAWNATWEAAEASVCRIAKCGRVPVNLQVGAGGAAGDYVVPVDDGRGGITGQIVPQANLTLTQYIKAIGYLRCPYAGDTSGRWEMEVKVG